MHIYVIVAVDELTLEGLPANGLRLDDDCIISPDIAEVLRLVDSPFNEERRTLRQVIGEVNRNTIGNAAGVTLIVQESDRDLDGDEAKRFLLRVMTLTQLFLFCLWLVRDNSGNTGDGLIALGVPGDSIRAVFTQRPGILNYNATSQRQPTAFTRVEIDVAARYFQQLNSVVLPQIEWRFDTPRPTALIFQSRIARALYFSQAARASADVGVRAMYYSLAFESLLSAETGRYSHNVPTRASQLLGTTRRERQPSYDDVYALYGYRSDVVHGATFDEVRLRTIRETTERCDGRLRDVLTKILNDPELLTLFMNGRNKEISHHFNDEPKNQFPERARPPGPGQCG